MKEEYVCCFTGHRELDPRHTECLPLVLEKVIDKLVGRGVTEFRAGGALGFDTVAALKVLEKKRECGFVRLELFLPCRNQSDGWGNFNKQTYALIMQKADGVTYTSENYYNGCMQLRNRRLVDGSDFCVTYCNKKRGGTAYTVNYAQKKGVGIIDLFSLCEKYISE